MSTFYDRALPEGGSGYLSEPTPTLDPNLFEGKHLRPEVRTMVLATLESGLMRYLDLTGVNEWLHAWLAGSGITYQWSADRGNGDLDVLFGVDMQRFVHWNPDYQGIPESSVADHTDQVLKQKLWPRTANTQLGGRTYEVTFYWNPGTGTDITRIHPYAAYDLKRDAWVVLPPSLPADPRALYPDEWFDAAGRDTDAAKIIARRHASLKQRLPLTPAGSPAEVNAHANLGRVEDAATALFEDIHGGRREAFGEQGHGYGDYANFRWQLAKQNGVVAGLSAITADARMRRAESDALLYSGPIDAANKIVTRDMLRYGHGQ